MSEEGIGASQKTTYSIVFGILVSAVIPLSILFVPIYFLFLKPFLEKRNKNVVGKQSDKTRDVTTNETKKKNLLLDQSNTVAVEDMEYLSTVLSPDSTHMDILFAVMTTPENIEWSIQDLERAESVYKDRMEKEKKNSKNNDKKNNETPNFDDLFSEDGWADENDDEDDEQNKDAVLKAKLADEERKKDMERLKQATGQAVQLLEGIDDGVIGQKWVEKSLEAAGVWPPKNLSMLKNAKYEYQGKSVSVLEHPGLRRLLCMTIGRLNSLYLNGHPELLEAGSKKLIDQTYFRSSMEYRQRAAMILEAALRIGMMVRSSRLVITIIETVCMFKIGTTLDEKAVSWFDNLMMKQYNVLPRLNIKNQAIITPEETNIVCGDISEVEIEIERPHAENFLRQKLAMFQKQGIPPQVGLSTYREGWWFMLCMKRVDDSGKTVSNPKNTVVEPLFDKDSPAFQHINFDKQSLAKFEKENVNDRLITAWPMLIQNVSQKSGQIKIQIKIPSTPGKYIYTIYIKSQEFMNADMQFDIPITVVDSNTGKRQAKIPTPPETKDEKNDSTIVVPTPK